MTKSSPPFYRHNNKVLTEKVIPVSLPWADRRRKASVRKWWRWCTGWGSTWCPPPQPAPLAPEIQKKNLFFEKCTLSRQFFKQIKQNQQLDMPHYFCKWQRELKQTQNLLSPPFINNRNPGNLTYLDSGNMETWKKFHFQSIVFITRMEDCLMSTLIVKYNKHYTVSWDFKCSLNFPTVSNRTICYFVLYEKKKPCFRLKQCF